jgi:hypothetical protein
MAAALFEFRIAQEERHDPADANPAAMTSRI